MKKNSWIDFVFSSHVVLHEPLRNQMKKIVVVRDANNYNLFARVSI